MKMSAHLLLKRQTLEKIIHQVGFAAPYSAPKIQSAYQLALFRLKQSLDKTTQPRCGRLLCAPGGNQLLVKLLQMSNCRRLCSVMAKVRARQIALIALLRGKRRNRCGY